jgi:hypothetical protein
LGSIAFFGTSGFYIRNLIRSRPETQNQAIEFNTSAAIELSPVSIGVGQSTETKNIDEEIVFFEKRKKLAQLKNEVMNLEAVGVRDSTSDSLGQVISVSREV